MSRSTAPDLGAERANPLCMIHPDLGSVLTSAAQPGAEFVFVSVPVASLARVEAKLFSTTLNIPVNGQTLAATFDFSWELMIEILAELPADVAEDAVATFARRFVKPVVVSFPAPVVVQLTARLGEPQTNADETYVPLVVTAVGSQQLS